MRSKSLNFRANVNKMKTFRIDEFNEKLILRDHVPHPGECDNVEKAMKIRESFARGIWKWRDSDNF